jgi:hypothetical protein
MDFSSSQARLLSPQASVPDTPQAWVLVDPGSEAGTDVGLGAQRDTQVYPNPALLHHVSTFRSQSPRWWRNMESVVRKSDWHDARVYGGCMTVPNHHPLRVLQSNRENATSMGSPRWT